MRRLAIILAILLLPSTAFAEDEPLWKRVGQWQIRVDRTIDFGCFVFSSFKKGTVLRIGFNPRDDNAYLIIGNDAWSSLEVGKEYDLGIKYDNEPMWKGTATAVDLWGATMLWVTFANKDFLLEFMKKQSVTFFYREKVVTTLYLNQSFEAGRELVACQQRIEQVRSEGRGGNDPFAARGTAPTRKSSDPFKF